MLIREQNFILWLFFMLPNDTTYLSGEMISPEKTCAISCAMKLKKLAAFQRNETVKEKGRYEILGLANSKRGNHERKWGAAKQNERSKDLSEKRCDPPLLSQT